jgi:uncharacterized membrane protein
VQASLADVTPAGGIRAIEDGTSMMGQSVHMRRDDLAAGSRAAGSRAALAAGAAAAGPAFAVYLALGWVRFSTGAAGNYDLGIFTQAAQRWASGRWPGSSIRSVDNLFADHFSPITALFGLGWRIWPDPRMLIVVQALALGTAVGIIGVAAARRLPPWAAFGLALAAGSAKGMISAASFDVHETVLGTPIMAGLVWALLERRFRAAVWCATALLLVKEDLGLTVAAAGVAWWWLTGERRRGGLLVALGAAGFVVANAVVVAVSPDHRSPYLQFLLGATGNPQGLVGAVMPGGTRWAPAVLFALTAGIVGLRSPLALVALPTLAWRAVSSNTSYWQTYFHYDVILVPIAAFALLDVLGRVRGGDRAAGDGRRGRVVAGVAAIGVVWAAGMGVGKIAAWRPWGPGRYVLAEPQRDAALLAREIPRGAPVVVQQDLGPPVLARVDVRMLASTVPARGEWVLLTTDGDQLGAPVEAKRAWLARQRARPAVSVRMRGAVVLVRLPTIETVQLPTSS